MNERDKGKIAQYSAFCILIIPFHRIRLMWPLYRSRSYRLWWYHPERIVCVKHLLFQSPLFQLQERNLLIINGPHLQ